MTKNKKLTAKERHITQGMGVAIHYAYTLDVNYGELLFQELNVPLEDYESACDEVDLKSIRKAAGK